MRASSWLFTALLKPSAVAELAPDAAAGLLEGALCAPDAAAVDAALS